MKNLNNLLLLAALIGAGPAAGQGAACDESCLEAIAADYMAALVAQEPGRLPWAERVYFTEDQVSMMIGDALWGSISAKSGDPLVVADSESGNVAWFGWVEEHGAPAYYGMRLKVEDGRIAEVETVNARREEPGLFGEEVNGFAPAQELGGNIPGLERGPRQRLVDIAAGHYSTMQLNDGKLFTDYAPDCQWVENGASLTPGSGEGPADCGARMAQGLHKPVDRVRERRFPLVNEEAGIVVAFSTRDIDNRESRWTDAEGRVHDLEGPIYFPHSRGTVDIFRIRDGRISRIETISNFLPYGMPSPWMVTPRPGSPPG